MKSMEELSAIHAMRPHVRRGPDVRLTTGASAIVVAVLTVAEFLVQAAAGARPALDDEAALAEFQTRTSMQTLNIILLDTFLMAFLIVFLAGFRQLITHAQADLQWVADLAFGAGIAFVTVTLVGDAMEGGGALDTMGATPDPSVIRALTEGHMLMFGSIGCVLTALVAGASGYVTFVSGALPRWTGWIAYAVAVLNIAAVFTMFGGTSSTSLFSAGGSGTALFATFPWLVWVVAVGFVTIRDRRRN
jgi:hypothetical protein